VHLDLARGYFVTASLLCAEAFSVCNFLLVVFSIQEKNIMKLSGIVPLVGCMFTAVGILASTSPAHALTYNWSFDGLANTGGSFDLDSTGTLIQDWSGQVNGVTITALSATGSYNGNDNAYPLTSNGVSFSTASINYNLYFTNSTYELDGTDSLGSVTSYYGAFTTNAPSSVPFNIPGGATIPTVGSLLALGAMRKARKSIASKTRSANPVVRVS
jgi:hypothetical protein